MFSHFHANFCISIYSCKTVSICLCLCIVTWINVCRSSSKNKSKWILKCIIYVKYITIRYCYCIKYQKTATGVYLRFLGQRVRRASWTLSSTVQVKVLCNIWYNTFSIRKKTFEWISAVKLPSALIFIHAMFEVEVEVTSCKVNSISINKTQRRLWAIYCK